MSSEITKEAFLAHWSAATVDQIRDALKESGHALKARKKDDALEEAWLVYRGKAKPADEPKPAAPAAPAPAGEAVWEARLAGLGAPRQRQRAGFKFVGHGVWHELKGATPEQLEQLKADRFLQVRLKG